MTTEALKTSVITNLDANPPVRASAGKGAAGVVREIDGALTVTDTKTAGSTYRMVRIPSNAKVKHVRAWLQAAVTTFTADIGLYYSSSDYDGTQDDLQSDVIDADFFGSAVALAAIVTPTDYTHESAVYTAADRLLPIWEAAGLSADPGGFFDIALTTTATTDGAAVPILECEYVE